MHIVEMDSAAPRRARVAVIGGSGLYNMPGVENAAEYCVKTPFGDPSDAIVVGELNGMSTAFLPRHGRGHRFTPSEVPYLANLWALKKLGVEFIISVSAVGSMREEIAPGTLVLVDQFIDRTLQRPRTFFGRGVVGHVSFADPICETLRKIVLSAAQEVTSNVVDGGTYVCIEGPTFSTKAESRLYRSWGVSVIGMTNMPEARLAREAGMSYATIALATDYDCWHESEEAVSVEAVVATLQKNVSTAQQVIKNAVAKLAAPDAPQQSPYHRVADGAVMTHAERLPAEVMRELAILFPAQS